MYPYNNCIRFLREWTQCFVNTRFSLLSSFFLSKYHFTQHAVSFDEHRYDFQNIFDPRKINFFYARPKTV